MGSADTKRMNKEHTRSRNKEAKRSSKVRLKH